MAKLAVVVVDSARRETKRNQVVDGIEVAGHQAVVISRTDLAADPGIVLRPRGRRARSLQDLDLARGALLRLQDETERAGLSLKLLEAELATQVTRVANANEHLAGTQAAANAGLAAREAAQAAVKEAEEAVAAARRLLDETRQGDDDRSDRLNRLLAAADQIDRYIAWADDVTEHPARLIAESVRHIGQVRETIGDLIATEAFDESELIRFTTALSQALINEGPMIDAAVALWDRLEAAERERDERVASAIELAAERERALAALEQLDADLRDLQAQQKPIPSPEFVTAVEAAYTDENRKRKRSTGPDAQTMLAEAGWDSYLDFHLARSQGFVDQALTVQIQRAADRRIAAEQWLADVEDKIAQNGSDADRPVADVVADIGALIGATPDDARSALVSLQQPPVVPAGVRAGVDVEIARCRAAIDAALATAERAGRDVATAEAAVQQAKAAQRDAQRRALVAVNELESERALVKAAEGVLADLEARGEELRRQAGGELDRYGDAENVVRERLEETQALRTEIRRAAEGDLPALAAGDDAELDQVRARLWSKLPSEDAPAVVVFDDAFSELEGPVALRLIVTLTDLPWPATYLTDDPVVVAWAEAQQRLHADPAITIER